MNFQVFFPLFSVRHPVVTKSHPMSEFGQVRAKTKSTVLHPGVRGSFFTWPKKTLLLKNNDRFGHAKTHLLTSLILNKQRTFWGFCRFVALRFQIVKSLKREKVQDLEEDSFFSIFRAPYGVIRSLI